MQMYWNTSFLVYWKDESLPCLYETVSGTMLASLGSIKKKEKKEPGMGQTKFILDLGHYQDIPEYD